jgi:hypothetical protein
MGHHYNPQELLRGFAEPGSPEMIHQYDNRQGSWSRASIKKVAQERSFYTPEIEDLLNRVVEAPANSVMNTLRDGKPVDSTGRAELAYYMATAMKRVPRHRDKAKELAPAVLADVTKELKEALAVTGQMLEEDLESVAGILKRVDECKAKFEKELSPETMEAIRTPWPSNDLVAAIYHMHWRFLAAAGGSFFVTSDNPVLIFDALGVANLDSQLSFPLSSKLALMADWQPTPTPPVVENAEKLVKEVNRRTAFAATRFLFCQQEAAWVESVGQTNDVCKLNMIRW